MSFVIWIYLLKFELKCKNKAPLLMVVRKTIKLFYETHKTNDKGKSDTFHPYHCPVFSLGNGTWNAGCAEQAFSNDTGNLES